MENALSVALVLGGGAVAISLLLVFAFCPIVVALERRIRALEEAMNRAGICPEEEE